MQLAGGHAGQPAAAQTLKRKERSPSPQPNKRRAPSYYSHAPNGSLHGWPFDASSLGDVPAASSERSSPGVDWLRRTQELHLQTPPLGAQHSFAGDPAGGLTASADTDANGDVGMDGDAARPTPFLPEQDLAPTSIDLRQTSDHLYHPVPIAPHHAPPLHRHLAGSPQAEQCPPSRPPSVSDAGPGAAGAPAQTSQLGAASFGLAGPIDWSQQPASAIAAEDAAMTDAATAAARRHGGGGWKVTMGYRADCVKCRQRVPGHYSHVVPT
ncbi:hypothetical protein JCM3774_006777 [Rhodotorula dairenensis]